MILSEVRDVWSCLVSIGRSSSVCDTFQESSVAYLVKQSVEYILLACQSVMVQTLSRGELGILLRGSAIRSSAVREMIMEIYGSDS